MSFELAHISLYKRRDNAGFHLGGVETFGQYLQRAIPEMNLISFADYPDWQQHLGEPDYVKASVLNSWLLKTGALDKDSVVVVDGYWGMGLEEKVARLISVCHGSYYGRFIQSQLSPWGEVVGMDHIETQLDFFRYSGTEVVCVAQGGVKELEGAGIYDTHLIYHGIDLGVYKPTGKGTVLMHAATSERKGTDILRGITTMFPDIEIEEMAEWSGEPEKKAARLNEARAFIAPTRHEGNAYLLIEALACGIPLVTYQTGLACEMDERCGLITDDFAPHNFARLIQQLDEQEFAPREWAEEMCDFDAFAAEWREYLDA